MSNHLDGQQIINEIRHRIQVVKQELDACHDAQELPTTPEALENLEQSLQGKARELSDLMSAAKIQEALQSDALRDEAKAFVKNQPGKYKLMGQRTVNVRFAGGTVVPLKVPYYARKCDIGKGRKGFYPGLILLGIHDRCTPALAAEVSLASAALCSLEEARHMLEKRGCRLDICRSESFSRIH
jgi:hypothetical protein